jgi:hypothetical protein
MWMIVFFALIASILFLTDYFVGEEDSVVKSKKANKVSKRMHSGLVYSEPHLAHKKRIKRNKIKIPNSFYWGISAIVTILIVTVGLFTISFAPFSAFGGYVWLKDGVHYIDNEEVSNRIIEINAPKEALLVEKVVSSTDTCDAVEYGFCQKAPGDFYYKIQETPAVAYKPGIPDRKEVVGYCTLCNDGTFSPSCAVGRGACSWHGGVSAYNVARYRTIQGTPEVKAKEATYSYLPRSYKESTLYLEPTNPDIKEVVGFEKR